MASVVSPFRGVHGGVPKGVPGGVVWGVLAGSNDPLPSGARSALYAILLGAFVLRLGLALASPTIHQADEIYQVAEQANRAVHGYGIQSWEFLAKARSALYPALVVPMFWLDVGPAITQTLTAAFFTAFSLIPVAVAFLWVVRPYGVRGGIVAAFMMATWFELVYFAPKPTGDAVSSYFFLAALYLARPSARNASVALAGFSLFLTVALRMQIAPAVAIAGLLALLVNWRQRFGPLFAGVVVAMLLTGFIEWLWWGVPFLGHYNYLRLEFARDVSSQFGRQPLTFYGKNYVLFYGAALPVVALLAWSAAKKAPVLLIAALALALPFHFIPHKEYRFLVVAVPVLVMMMGVAAADLVARVPSLGAPRALFTGAAAWVVAMTAISLGDSYRPYWVLDRNHIRAFREIGARPDACGVALVGIRWFHTPGYSGLGRNIPIYEIGREALPANIVAAANYVLVGHKAPQPEAPYVRLHTYQRPEEHIYVRPGTCVPDPAAQITAPDTVPGGQ